MFERLIYFQFLIIPNFVLRNQKSFQYQIIKPMCIEILFNCLFIGVKIKLVRHSS